MSWLVKFVICLLSVAFGVYLYIDAINGVIELRLAIPHLQKDMHAIQAENDRLQYEIDRFESPLHLMELARKPEFSHLKPAYARDVLQVQEP